MHPIVPSRIVVLEPTGSPDPSPDLPPPPPREVNPKVIIADGVSSTPLQSSARGEDPASRSTPRVVHASHTAKTWPTSTLRIDPVACPIVTFASPRDDAHKPPPTWAEEAQTLRMPDGADEEMPDDLATSSPLGARVAMTRLTRALGRDYRRRHGVVLTMDAAGVELVQHHLARRLAAATSDRDGAAFLGAALTSHGAFLSEVLARRLGAEWCHVTSGNMIDWAMTVGAGTRVWPIWRIHHFLRQPWQGRGALCTFYERLQESAVYP